MRLRPLVTCIASALAAGAFLAAPAASAQDRPASRPAPTERRAEPEAQRPTPPARPSSPEVTAPVDGDEAAHLRRYAQQTAKHRERLARIARLRELAAAKGQQERIAALDALAKKQESVFEKRVAKIQEKIGSEKLERAKQNLRRPARPDADVPKRPSADVPKRPSADAPKRPSADTPKRPSEAKPERPKEPAKERPKDRPKDGLAPIRPSSSNPR